MDISTMGTVLAIVVITYLIGLLCKTISAIKDELIPVIVGAVGGLWASWACTSSRIFRRRTC